MFILFYLLFLLFLYPNISKKFSSSLISLNTVIPQDFIIYIPFLILIYILFIFWLMFIPLISSFKVTLSSKFPMYYLLKVWYLLLYSFYASLLQPLTTWSIHSSAFLCSLHSLPFWLLWIFALTKFVLILWFCPETIRLSLSLKIFQI